MDLRLSTCSTPATATTHEQCTALCHVPPYPPRVDGFAGRWYTTDAGTCEEAAADESDSSASGPEVDQVITTIEECRSAMDSLVAAGIFSPLTYPAGTDYTNSWRGPSRPRGCYLEIAWWGTRLRFSAHPSALTSVDQGKEFICTNGVQPGAISIPDPPTPASSATAEAARALVLSPNLRRVRDIRPPPFGPTPCSSRECVPVCICGPASSGPLLSIVRMHRCSLHRADCSPEHPSADADADRFAERPRRGRANRCADPAFLAHRATGTIRQ